MQYAVLAILSSLIIIHFSYLFISDKCTHGLKRALIWIRMFYSCMRSFIEAHLLKIYSIFGITGVYFQLLKTKGTGEEIAAKLSEFSNITLILLTIYCAFVFLPRKGDLKDYLEARSEALQRAPFLMRKKIPKYPPVIFMMLTMASKFSIFATIAYLFFVSYQLNLVDIMNAIKWI